MREIVGVTVCHIFGVPAEKKINGQTLLVVRDFPLSEDSEKELKEAQTDALYSEIKHEVAIDRVTQRGFSPQY